jgi:hypothetical protein
MLITISLDDEQSRRLIEKAARLGVDPLELATAAVRELISKPELEFSGAAARVLEKNRELYQRLTAHDSGIE